MKHPRTLIRDQVKSIISVIGELDGSIFTSRSAPIQASELPAAVIYTPDEDSEQLYIGKPTLDRDVRVAIEIYDRDTDNPDESLDTLAQLVENAMDDNTVVQGLWINSWLSRTETAFDESGEKANGMCRLVYRVRYQTAPG